jgi:hypothetical protein
VLELRNLRAQPIQQIATGLNDVKVTGYILNLNYKCLSCRYRTPNKCFINYPVPLNFIINFSCAQTIIWIIKTAADTAAGQLIKHLLDILTPSFIKFEPSCQ